jgi:hypothetical protein
MLPDTHISTLLRTFLVARSGALAYFARTMLIQFKDLAYQFLHALPEQVHTTEYLLSTGPCLVVSYQSYPGVSSPQPTRPYSSAAGTFHSLLLSNGISGVYLVSTLPPTCYLWHLSICATSPRANLNLLEIPRSYFASRGEVDQCHFRVDRSGTNFS